MPHPTGRRGAALIWVVGGQADAEGQVRRMSGIVRTLLIARRSKTNFVLSATCSPPSFATVPMVICSFIRHRGGRWSFPFAGPEIRQIYGFEASELVENASGIFRRIHPDDQAHFLATLRASGSTMTHWRAEYRVNHPSRGKIWVEAHAVPLSEPDDTILWHGYLGDITERKNAEKALEEQGANGTVRHEHRPRSGGYGARYQYLFANEAYTQIYGLDTKEVK